MRLSPSRIHVDVTLNGLRPASFTNGDNPPILRLLAFGNSAARAVTARGGHTSERLPANGI